MHRSHNVEGTGQHDFNIGGSAHAPMIGGSCFSLKQLLDFLDYKNTFLVKILRF